MQKLMRLFVVSFGLLLTLNVSAETVSPDELIKSTSEKVLAALEQNREKYAQQPNIFMIW